MERGGKREVRRGQECPRCPCVGQNKKVLQQRKHGEGGGAQVRVCRGEEGGRQGQAKRSSSDPLPACLTSPSPLASRQLTPVTSCPLACLPLAPSIHPLHSSWSLASCQLTPPISRPLTYLPLAPSIHSLVSPLPLASRHLTPPVSCPFFSSAPCPLPPASSPFWVPLGPLPPANPPLRSPARSRSASGPGTPS